MISNDWLRTTIKKYLWLIIALLIYLPQIFFGYGTDDDTYLVLGAAQKTVETGVYHPSRNPGYVIFEMTTWALDRLGGSIVTNTGTMIMTILALGCFYSICRFFNLKHPIYLLGLFMIHPYVWSNAAATQDYMWALGIFLYGFLLMLKQRYTLGAILLGLSIGVRLSSAFAVMCIIGYFLFIGAFNWKRFIVVCTIITFIFALSYVLSFANANWSLSFLNPHMGTNEIWTPLLKIGKGIYKSISFWGIQAVIFLVFLFFYMMRNINSFKSEQWRALSILSLSVVIIYEILFFIYPIEPGYLLPMLPFVLLFLGFGLKTKPVYYVILLILLFSSNFVKIDVMRPDLPRHATHAMVGLWIGDGPLIHDLRVRYYLKDCKTIEQWNQVMIEFWKNNPE
ncbi:MAG: hypothetical protein ABSB78_06735 [Bacteroidota bacterium]